MKYFFVITLLIFGQSVNSQNMHYFFVDDVYQRSYINPSLNNQKTVSIASGLGVDVHTSGPVFDDFLTKNSDGTFTLSSISAIPNMKDYNDVNGYTSVHTLDVSVDLAFVRISAGHAWKGIGWLQYSKDLISFLTYGNGPSIGETLDLAPKVDYLNYNEIYLGFQKSIGPVDLGLRIKRLSGVETLKTSRSDLKFTTSDDIYQLSVDSDILINSSSALTYADFDDFTINVENYSFDNFLSNNQGWALDFGASASLGERLELSVSILDIGKITWDKDIVNYTSSISQSYDGVDLSRYITDDQGLAISDSLRSLIKVEENYDNFETNLPMQIYVGGRLKLTDKWKVGILGRSLGEGDRRANTLAVNASYKMNTFISLGAQYSIREANPINLGLYAALYLGPVAGFISTDNVIGLVTPSTQKSTNLRAGLNVRI